MTLQGIVEEGERLLTCYYKAKNDYYNITDRIADEEKDNLRTWIHSGMAYLETYHSQSSEINLFKDAVYNEREDKDFVKILLSALKAYSNISDIKPSIDYSILDTIFNRFPSFIRQLKKRHDNRQTIVVKDEYDIQDLLEAVLRLHFDDVRAEEWCPSYAGGSKRMDFFLNDEKIAIETKMTREGLSDKQIGEQLTIDITNYKQHPNCETLYCFVYDPEGRIRNPNGLIKDLQNIDKEINIKIIIKPD